MNNTCEHCDHYDPYNDAAGGLCWYYVNAERRSSLFKPIFKRRNDSCHHFAQETCDGEGHRYDHL